MTEFEIETGELAAGRSASGVLSGWIGRGVRSKLAGRRVFDSKADTGQQIAGGTSPPRSFQAAAAVMILAATAEGTEGSFGGFLRGCLGHSVMAVHCGLDKPNRLAHAVHGFRLTCAGERQRPGHREEYSQQQESCRPTMHSLVGAARARGANARGPTPNGAQHTSIQCPVAST